MNIENRSPEQIISDTLVRKCIRDGEPRFSVIIDDAEAGTYAIKATSYVDADRGGYCGDRSEEIANGLTQMQATQAVTLLNEAKVRVAETYKIRR